MRLCDFIAKVEARKAELGITDEDIAAARRWAADMKELTREAWRKAEAATAGRKPRFGYRRDKDGSHDT